MIVALLLLGYLYFRIAGEAYALVSIGLISFAAVAQFAPALLGGMYWKGGTRAGALAGLLAGFALWVYTLMLPSIAKSGWMPARLHRPRACSASRCCGREQLFGLTGARQPDAIRCSGACWRTPGSTSACRCGARRRRARPRQALLFVDVFERHAGAGAGGRCSGAAGPRSADLRALPAAFSAQAAAQRAVRATTRGARASPPIDAIAGRRRSWCSSSRRQLAGAIGSASARVMVASVVEEEPLGLDDVMRILDEASQLRAYSHALEEKSQRSKARPPSCAPPTSS